MSPRLLRRLTSLLGGGDHLDGLVFQDAGHGFDRFGLHPEHVAFGDALIAPIYNRYFRVKSYDQHNIPTSGPAVLAANHSGTIPIDGMMIYLDVLRHTHPPRVPRPIADYFVPSLPFVGTLFARCGMVGGSRGNARALLESGEMLMIFPEGVPGVGKPFSERYKLQEWRQGHCELAIRHSAPVIPVAVVGAEEQMPQLARIPVKGPIPYIPIPATLIPFPVRYHIYYGEPVRVDREFTPNQADDPEVIAAAALRVKAAVQALLARGLREREGVFR